MQKWCFLRKYLEDFSRIIIQICMWVWMQSFCHTLISIEWIYECIFQFGWTSCEKNISWKQNRDNKLYSTYPTDKKLHILFLIYAIIPDFNAQHAGTYKETINRKTSELVFKLHFQFFENLLSGTDVPQTVCLALLTSP